MQDVRVDTGGSGLVVFSVMSRVLADGAAFLYLFYIFL